MERKYVYLMFVGYKQPGEYGGTLYMTPEAFSTEEKAKEHALEGMWLPEHGDLPLTWKLQYEDEEEGDYKIWIADDLIDEGRATLEVHMVEVDNGH